MLRTLSILLCLTTLGCFKEASRSVAQPAAPRAVSTADALMQQAPPPELLLCAPNMKQATLVDRQRVFAHSEWNSPHDTLTTTVDGSKPAVVPFSLEVGVDWLKTKDTLISLTSDAHQQLPAGADVSVRSFQSFGGIFVAQNGTPSYFIQRGGKRHEHPLGGYADHELLLGDALWMTTSECRLQRAGADGVVRCFVDGAGRSVTALGEHHILFGIGADGPDGVGVFDITANKVVDLGCEVPLAMGSVESPPALAIRCGEFKGGIWTPAAGYVETETAPNYIVGALDERRLEHQERYLLMGSDDEAPREYFDAVTNKVITTDLYLSGATKEGFARHGTLAFDSNADASYPIDLPSCGTATDNPYEAEQWWRTKDRMGHLEIAMCTEWVSGPRLEKMRTRKPTPSCHDWDLPMNFVKHYVLIDLRNGAVVPLKGGKPIGLTQRGVVYTRGSPNELDGKDGTSIWIQGFPPDFR